MADDDERKLPGRVLPLVAWPQTRLTTLICHGLGLSRYDELPTPGFNMYGFFMTPLAYLFLFDLELKDALSVRHVSREGRLLRDFRAACRRFFKCEDPVLEGMLVRLADIWLAFTSVKDGEQVSDDMLDRCVEEALGVHREMAKALALRHADATNMPAVARRVFLAAGEVLDLRLPTHLRAAATAAEKAESQQVGRKVFSEKRFRDETLESDGGRRAGRFGGKAPKAADGNFWCYTCKAEFPRSDVGHRTSAAHLANKP
jgi:hypothetical protein